MTLVQSFSPPYGSGAAKQFALDGGSCLSIALVEAQCGEQMRCSPQRGLTGLDGDGIIKEQEGMTLLQSFSPPLWDWSRQTVRAGWRLASLFVALVKARCGEQMRCSPQRGLTGPHGDGIIKEQEGMTLL